jgi:hypothetical protein
VAGNLLIIDHGGGYMSLYGNNESLFKRVGEGRKAVKPWLESATAAEIQFRFIL